MGKIRTTIARGIVIIYIGLPHLVCSEPISFKKMQRRILQGRKCGKPQNVLSDNSKSPKEKNRFDVNSFDFASNFGVLVNPNTL